jgi:hypothetical protein
VFYFYGAVDGLIVYGSELLVILCGELDCMDLFGVYNGIKYLVFYMMVC